MSLLVVMLTLEDALVSAAVAVWFQSLLLMSWVVSDETLRISKEIGDCFSSLTLVSFQNLPKISHKIEICLLCSFKHKQNL